MVLLLGIATNTFAQEFQYTDFSGKEDYTPQKHRIPKGYRGFVDLGYSMGKGELKKKEDIFELITSHGYQLNPYLFLGGGVGFDFWRSSNVLCIPEFLNVRTDIPTGSFINPFFDLKFGYAAYTYIGDKFAAVADNEICFNVYGSLSAGCRIATSRRTAINLSIGYQLQPNCRKYYEQLAYDYYEYYSSYRESYSYDTSSKDEIFKGISVKLGFSF